MVEAPNRGVLSERRKKPRISTRFPIKVRGVRQGGERFEFETVIENLSASGVYLQSSERIEPQAKVELVIQLSESKTVPGLVVEAEGIVLRTEPRAAGLYGLAICFTRHRFAHQKASKSQ